MSADIHVCNEEVFSPPALRFLFEGYRRLRALEDLSFSHQSFRLF
jgi:hypothetical protein